MHTKAAVRSRLSAALICLAALAPPPPLDAQQIRYEERVDVARIIVDVRVLDSRGEPVLALEAADFRARVDGRPARIESVRWFAGDAQDEPPAPAPAGSDPSLRPEAAPGRLIVLFIQKDMETARIRGLLQMLPRASAFLDGLTPDDLVAVLSFDSHLKLWADFTDDRGHLARVLERSVLFGERLPQPESVPAWSLAARLDPEDARRAASVEQGLVLTAEALRELPGAKSLVLIGHGFGDFNPLMGVVMRPDYDRARHALTQARVTVFTLDVTQADYHSLEVGLQTVAEDTGGFYLSTFIFPDLAMERLERALAGHYVLILETPEEHLRSGQEPRSIRVDLAGRRGRVFTLRELPGRELPGRLR